MKNHDILAMGFMLFAMFFGAGNLIFPVGLGYEAGNHYINAMIGFMLTGIGLPLLTMIAGSFSNNGYPGLLDLVHPLFSTVFLIIVYVMIGPLSAIPRTATTSYEMAIMPLNGETSHWLLFIFSIIFFVVVLYLSLSPNNLADAIGKYLTPALLLTIGILIIRSLIMYTSHGPSLASERFNTVPALTSGFLDGYLTMDSMGALAFTLVLSSTIKQFGITDIREAIAGSVRSSLVASGLLGIIYFLLGWIGNRAGITHIPAAQNPGAYILVQTAEEGFGKIGVIILGIIVLLACITTATGLVSSVASYFHQRFPELSYRWLAIAITIFSCAVANLGLNEILKISTPFLAIVYPVTITIVFALLFIRWQSGPKLSIQLAIATVTLISVLSVLARSGTPMLSWLAFLPLYSLQLEWVLPTVIAFVIGYVIGSPRETIQFSD